MKTCPKCGQPDSTFDDRFCGRCESQYQQERHEERQRLIAIVRDCRCAEGCRTCRTAAATVAEMDGDFGRAAAILNP